MDVQAADGVKVTVDLPNEDDDQESSGRKALIETAFFGDYGLDDEEAVRVMQNIATDAAGPEDVEQAIQAVCEKKRDRESQSGAPPAEGQS